MTLAFRMLQPLVQGVIEEKTAGQQFLVVGVQSREAEGDGEQSGGLWREVQSVRIGSTNDDGKLMQRRVRQLILLQKSIEAAAGPVMRELDALHIVGDGVALRGASEDGGGRCKEELRLGINEALDQPWARDAVDLWMLASYPTHRDLASSGWLTSISFNLQSKHPLRQGMIVHERSTYSPDGAHPGRGQGRRVGTNSTRRAVGFCGTNSSDVRVCNRGLLPLHLAAPRSHAARW